MLMSSDNVWCLNSIYKEIQTLQSEVEEKSDSR